MKFRTPLIIAIALCGGAHAQQSDTTFVAVNQATGASSEDIDALILDSMQELDEERGYDALEYLELIRIAESQLLDEHIVEVNETVLRNSAETLNEADVGDYVNSSLAQLAQCSAFRMAQAISLSKRGNSTRAKLYQHKASLHEHHNYLLARAMETVFALSGLESELRARVKKEAPDMISTHQKTMLGSRSDEQAEQYNSWELQCREIEILLADEIEANARKLYSDDDVERRAEQLGRELAASQ